MKIWTPAEDEHLHAMRNMGAPRVAARLNCTVAEVFERREHLKKVYAQEDEPQTEKKLPKGVTAQQIQNALSPVQVHFIEASAHYKSLGGKMQDISELLSAALADVELTDLINRALKQPRIRDESVAEKLARVLLEDCIVIPKTKSA